MMILLIMLVFTRVVALLMLNVILGSDTLEMSLELAVPLLFRQRTHLHVDVSSGHLGLLVHMSHGVQILLDPLGELMPKFLVRHLTPLELKLNAHLVTFRQEVFGVDNLDVVIVGIDADAELQFLHLATLVVLVSFLLVLFLKVFVLAVIDDFADGRLGVRSHLHQVQSTLASHADRLRRWQDTIHMVRDTIHHAHFRRTNAFIDARLIDITSVVGTASSIGASTAHRARTSSHWRTIKTTACLPAKTSRALRTRPQGRWWCTRGSGCLTWAALILPSGELVAVKALEWIANGIPPGWV